jgi:arylsulfatase A-like enzyme
MNILLRDFLKLTAACAAMFVVTSVLDAQTTLPAPHRPNFIFVVTDDQRWDALGVVQREQGPAARFPWLQTPNMDRLAREGMRFRNAFVVSSLCSPSRACFLTGQYNHLNGVAKNSSPLPTGSITWATELQHAGYQTGYVGKWHMGTQQDRPGFDFVASYMAHGRYEDAPFLVNGKSVKTHGWIDDVATDYAIEFVRSQRDNPFGLVVGYKAPHEPRTPPSRAKSLYAHETVRPIDSQSSLPPFRSAPKSGLDEEQIREYFRCITSADENLGRLLAVLDELKLTDRTVVVFCGDNGFYLGEHGLDDKRSAYEESIRIPLLVRYPKLITGGAVNDAMVLNIDLAPTFLDLAGIAIPPSMQGKSWRPLWDGTEDTRRSAFLYEYFTEAAYPNEPAVLAVRTEKAKLIRYPGHEGWQELFDLSTDPHEIHNLAGDPKSREFLKVISAELDRQVRLTDYRVPDFADPVQR